MTSDFWSALDNDTMIEWIFFDLGSTLLDETDRVNERIEATSKLLHVDITTFRSQLEHAAKTH